MAAPFGGDLKRNRHLKGDVFPFAGAAEMVPLAERALPLAPRAAAPERPLLETRTATARAGTPRKPSPKN